MLILDATTKSLTAVLAGAVATTELPFVASYVDVTTTTYTPGSTDGVTTGAAAVTVVAAPAASTQRQIKLLTVYNADTVAATVKVRLTVSGTPRVLVSIALAVGSTLVYTDGEGWRVLTAAGAVLSTGAPHAATHADGGSDEIVVTGLSGVLADPQPPIIGAGATQAVAGNDARLTNARTPTAHAASHASGGSDALSGFTVAQGGTGVATLAAHGVVVGNGASPVAVTGAGTAGQVLTSNGASADPSFQAAAGGSVGVSTVTTTGTITALALPSGSGDLVIYMNNASLTTIQGIAAGLSGQRLVLMSMGAGQVDLAHENAGATAANRLINCATSGNTPLASGSGTAEYVYDAAAARWRLVAHEQGAWITPTYAAGNYTGSGSMTWTVDAGDVTAQAYWLKGRTVHIVVAIFTTTIGGTPSTALRIGNGGWGGFTAGKELYKVGRITNGGTNAVGFMQAPNGGTVINVFNDLVGGTNWTAGTNNAGVIGDFFFEVT